MSLLGKNVKNVSVILKTYIHKLLLNYKKINGEDVEQGEHSFIAGGHENLYSHFGNQCGGFRKLRHDLPHDPAVPFLGIYLKDAQ